MTQTTELTEQQRKQNTFDAVWQHSAQMSEQSKNDKPGSKGGCLYRADNGNKCFMGALIPDSLYDRHMDFDPEHDSGIDCMLPRFPDLEQYFRDEGYSRDIHFLDELQGIHDHNFVNREVALRRLADECDLTVPA